MIPRGVKINFVKGGMNIWFSTILAVISRWISGSFCFLRNHRAGEGFRSVPVMMVGGVRSLVESHKDFKVRSKGGIWCSLGFIKKNEISRGICRLDSLIGSILKVRVYIW